MDTKFQKGHTVPKEWRNAVSQSRKGHIPWNTGKSWNEKTRNKISDSKKGISVKHSGQFIKGFTPWNKGIGNKTPIAKRLRTSPKFKEWREFVFARDNWTCQECGQRGGKLHPHHLKRLSEYPELCYVVSNGITLCVSCHRLTDTFGNRNIKRTQCTST